MPSPRIPRIADDWTVWACTDVHGMTSALVAALRAAGLIDRGRRLIAPPRTALVGCGDYLDRGADVRGTVRLLRGLQADAAAQGGAVVLARGNHEVMPLLVRDGSTDWLDTWLEYGGDATMRSFGCDGAHELDVPADPGAGDGRDGARGRHIDRVVRHMESCAPGLFEWLDSLPQAVRWRDVLFVHGGLVPHHALDDFGTATEEHLWVRDAFYDTPWDSGAFDAYRAAGIQRVVFGHTPQPDGPTVFHDGHSIDIDTNAVGNPRLPEGAVRQLTLLRPGHSTSFDDAEIVAIPTHDAPERMGAPEGASTR